MTLYNGSASLKGDADAGSTCTTTRLIYPGSSALQGDIDGVTKLSYGQMVSGVGKLQGDSQANSVITALRRAILTRRPQIHLSVWTDEGEKALDQATLKRGDLHYLQAIAVGEKLSQFVLSTFILKASLSDKNADAIVWKSNQPSHGGIQLLSSSETVDRYGSAQQHVYQITLDPRDTAKLTSRRILQYEFQLDDTLGEIVSSSGSLTIIPDVFLYPS